MKQDEKIVVAMVAVATAMVIIAGAVMLLLIARPSAAEIPPLGTPVYRVADPIEVRPIVSEMETVMRAERREIRIMDARMEAIEASNYREVLAGWQNPYGSSGFCAPDPRNISQADLRLAGRIVHSEAHWECELGKRAVAQTILDRYYANPNMSHVQIMRHPNAFVIARTQYGCAECLHAAAEVLRYGNRPFPEYILLHFRSGVNHDRDWWAPFLMRVGAHAFYGHVRWEEIQ
ncbi:MAG: hypothetical protein FWC66_10070 [Oscillospiraceae bacterium]|nr:hypothetical protein [Oscillospiraceae bacterium]